MKTPSGNLTWLNTFSLVVLFGFFLSLPIAAPAANRTVNPEVVRLSYVQGDVRFSHADGWSRPSLAGTWEQAVVNLPIAAGDSLATGDGRAEIEFESGSTLYLAENSLLVFGTLRDLDGVPASDVELVSGTATASLHSVPKEIFNLRMYPVVLDDLPPVLTGRGNDFYGLPGETASGDICSGSSRICYDDSEVTARVDSYLNNSQLSFESDGRLITAGLFLAEWSANATLYNPPQPVVLTVAPDKPADWDVWVAARIKQRNADTAAAIKASGLASFVPGLTDLYRGGSFFPCLPYGTCWEPAPLPDTARAPATTDPRGPHIQLAAMRVALPQTGALQGGASGSILPSEYVPMPTCAYGPSALVDPVTGREILPQTGRLYSWPWALCHSGAWVHLPGRRTRFTFVTGRKRYQPPVVWMRARAHDVFVPLHPNDVAGKPPLNLGYGVFEVNKGRYAPYLGFQHEDFKPTEKYAPLKQAPDNFRDLHYPLLQSAERPEIQAWIRSAWSGDIPAKYDYKTQSFVARGTAAAG